MGRSPSSVAAGHYSAQRGGGGGASRLHSNTQSHRLGMPRSHAAHNESIIDNRSVGMRPQGKAKSQQGPVPMSGVLEPITTSRGQQLDSFGAVIDRSVAARSEERVFEDKGAAVDDIFAHVDSTTSSQVGGGHQHNTHRQQSNIRDDLVHWANPVSPQLASNQQRRAASPDPRSASSANYSAHQGRGSLSHSAAPSDIFASATVVRQQQHFGGSASGGKGSSGGGGRWDASPQTRAVSYTHLRAHETPEHLVCRLLLEKKKKKPSKDSDQMIVNSQVNYNYHKTHDEM
eukprot:TRINITY_DN5396_c0_g2_i1.p1 TRINITY_DN5396_c0_g2~~TRINITY_DN5396_c0_g2_i1.p1  ORF type:complete len:288 (-),score=45.53 TRINITY_DN5396_c0_g2_i1:14-877(-)